MVQRFFGLSGKNLLHAITLASTCGFLLFGYDQGVMSGIIQNKVFNDDFPQTKSKGSNDVHTSTIQGTVTAVYELGCFAGAIFALLFGDKLGRRKVMMTGATIMIIGTIIMVTCFKHKFALGQFIIGRVICGVGNGMNTSTIPSWQAETSKSHNRGALVCFEASMIAIGTVIAYWIDFGLDFVDSSVAWRFPIAFQIIFAIILCSLVLFLPESPRWLLTQHREEEALEILAALNGVDVSDPETVAQKDSMYESIKLSSKKVTNRELLHGGKSANFRRTAIGATSQIFQQLGGCNAVIYYAPVLYTNSLGMDRVESLILAGCTIIVYAIFACSAFYLVEKVGRRPLFLIGSFGQASSMIIIFACLIKGTKQAARGATFGLFLYLAFFGATWLSLPWLYPAEISSMKIRTKANAVSTSCNWIFNFFVVQVTPVMVASIGWGTYCFFAALNLCFIPVIYFFYPETKGRTLEELDIIFAKAHIHSKAAVQVAKDEPHMEHHEILEAIRQLDLHDQAANDVENPVEGSSVVENGEEIEKGSLSEASNENLKEASNDSEQHHT